jgi:hypothetical protein
MDDQVVLDHLHGRHVIGAYPMLEDENCWFLAADFDESSWKEDVTAFVATCHDAGLPVAVERSRSGEGVHVWFFFATPVPATIARKMGCYFAAALRKVARHVVVLQGGMSAKERREIAAQLAAIPDTEERIVLATGRHIGEGFDDARLDTLFLALPISWKGTLIQYTGRLHRLHPRKAEVQILDYVDREVPMLLRMFEKQLRTYRTIGYARGEAPLGFKEKEELVVEYDEEALRHFEEVT